MELIEIIKTIEFEYWMIVGFVFVSPVIFIAIPLLVSKRLEQWFFDDFLEDDCASRYFFCPNCSKDITARLDRANLSGGKTHSFRCQCGQKQNWDISSRPYELMDFKW